MEPAAVRITRKRLHDGLCQHLTGAAMFAQVLANELESRKDPGVDQATKLVELINAAVDEVQAIMAETTEQA